MPKEPTIIDQKVVIPATREENQYGDLIFFDGDGNQHKIGNKRPHLFENIIVGIAVELYYAQYMERKYICGAKLVEGELKPPQSDQKVLPEHQEVIDKAVKEGAKLEPKKEHNPQETGLAYKVTADLYVHGFLDENIPDDKELVLCLKLWLKDVLLGR